MYLNVSIITERFIIRELTKGDASHDYLSWFSQKEIKNYIQNVPKSMTEIEHYIELDQNNSNTLLLGVFARKNNNHIGNIRYSYAYNGFDDVDMGIIIGDKNWRGKGVAQEVIVSTAKYLLKNKQTKKIILGVQKSNASAIKAYEKIGFVTKSILLPGDPEKEGLLMVWNLLK